MSDGEWWAPSPGARVRFRGHTFTVRDGPCESRRRKGHMLVLVDNGDPCNPNSLANGSTISKWVAVVSVQPAAPGRTS